MTDRFQFAANEYAKLKSQLTAGQITRAQFDDAIKKLMVQDAHGQWWMLGGESGKWFTYNGHAWVEGNPYPPPASAPPPPMTNEPTRPVSPSTQATVPFVLPNSITAFLAPFMRMGWRGLWPFALILLYVILTRNVTAIIIGVAIAIAIRLYAKHIDRVLAPVWPLRDMFPYKMRRILAWVVPVLVAFLIATIPLFYSLFAWTSFFGAETPVTALFTFSALVSAFIGYVFLREPQREGRQ